jgi:uncharacterized membrane protein YphA (DoxX/SURF4 family)
LRAVVGFTLVLQGLAYLIDWHELKLEAWTAGTLAVVGGICLLTGFLTPIAGLFTALVSIAITLSWIPVPARNLFDNNLVIIDVFAMATAIAFLGPGAFSLDARLFGRREITIPTISRSSLK